MKIFKGDIVCKDTQKMYNINLSEACILNVFKIYHICLLIYRFQSLHSFNYTLKLYIPSLAIVALILREVFTQNSRGVRVERTEETSSLVDAQTRNQSLSQVFA